jgi:hypothetical protein
MTDVALHFNSSQFIKTKGIGLEEQKWVRMLRETRQFVALRFGK